MAYEAFCPEYDIAAQADTQEEADALLAVSVNAYLSSLDDEAPEVRARLLGRRAPSDCSRTLHPGRPEGAN